MKCPNCGLETMGTGGVCHVCGARLTVPRSENSFAPNSFAQAEYSPKTGGNTPGNAVTRPGYGGRRPIWKNNTFITASLILLCAVLLAGIVALTRPGKSSEPAAPVQPATPGEPVDTNRYKVQQAMEAERARNGGADSVPASGGGGAVPSSGGGTSSPASGNGGGSSGNGGNVTPSRTGYLLEGSDSRYIQRSELAGFTAEDCRLARNEIYARHGRKFQDKSIQAYFDSLDWYRPTIEADDFSEDMLNRYETSNRNLIVKYEQEKGYR